MTARSSHSRRSCRARWAVPVSAAAALLVLLGGLSPVSATSVREGSIFSDLEWAHAVITTTIGSSRVESDHRGVPQTIYDLLDVEVLKGDPPYPFEIRIDGGVLDSGLGLKVPGTPEFAEGDRVLLFLRMDNPIAPIIGLQARTFRIDERAGRQYVTTYDGRPVVGLDEELRIDAAASPGEDGLTLGQFVDLLREMMERPEYQDRSR